KLVHGGVKRGESKGLCGPGTIELVEDEGRPVLGRNLDDVGRRRAIARLMPGISHPCQHDLVLHSTKRGAASKSVVAKRGQTGVAQHPADASVGERFCVRSARLAWGIRVMNLQGTSDI